MDDSKFAGKVVVVTGSGTGIGQAIAKRFAENGATIILLGRRKAPLEQTRAELEKIVASTGSKGKIRIFPGVDVSDEIAISNMFSTISKEIGPVDILVNNAGVSGPVKLFTKTRIFYKINSIRIFTQFIYQWKNTKCMNEAHTAEHNVTHEDSEESETIKIVNLNEIFASQMNKKGLIAEAVPIGTLNLEREEYYNNDISSNPRFITNRGCIMIKDKEISMIQIIQRY